MSTIFTDQPSYPSDLDPAIRNFCKAMIVTAIEDLVKPKVWISAVDRVRTFLWLFGEDEHARTLTFSQCCHAVGWDPDWLSQGLWRVRGAFYLRCKDCGKLRIDVNPKAMRCLECARKLTNAAIEKGRAIMAEKRRERKAPENPGA